MFALIFLLRKLCLFLKVEKLRQVPNKVNANPGMGTKLLLLTWGSDHLDSPKKKKNWSSGETAQHLRAFGILRKTPNLVPGSHIRQLNACNSSPRVSSALFWPSWVSSHIYAQTFLKIALHSFDTQSGDFVEVCVSLRPISQNGSITDWATCCRLTSENRISHHL